MAGVLVCVADAAKLLAQAGAETTASKQAACHLAHRLLLWLASLPPSLGQGAFSCFTVAFARSCIFLSSSQHQRPHEWERG